MSTYVPRFVAFLSARRRALGLSPTDLAASCDLAPNATERMEHGQFLPSPSQAYQLGLTLEVDPVELGRRATSELLLHPEFLCEHVA